MPPATVVRTVGKDNGADHHVLRERANAAAVMESVPIIVENEVSAFGHDEWWMHSLLF